MSYTLRFNLSKAVREIVTSGSLKGYESDFDYNAEREILSESNAFNYLRAGNPRDVGLNVPIGLFTRAADVASSGFPIGLETVGASNLLTWSACLKAGATILSGLRNNASLWSITKLPSASWLAETAPVTPSDPTFVGYPVQPRRISAEVNISRQLVIQGGPDLNRILISDLSRQLASALDQSALYGLGPTSNQPLGLANVPGVNQGFAINPADPHSSFCALEKLVSDANVDISSYAVLASTDVKRILDTTPAFTNGSDSTWEKLAARGISSPEITDARCFAGAWDNMVFAIWGPGVEVLVDSTTAAANGLVKIYANLFCDVGVRYPSAFAVTAPVT